MKSSIVAIFERENKDTGMWSGKETDVSCDTPCTA